MLNMRIKRLAADAGRALDRLAAVEASVAALGDEDLLNLADIFAASDPTPLRDMAEAEMRRRNLTL
ncbi:hypothetical protein GGQ80_003429 [Sphingomonas jinjuensis]|uniref:Uncharacterized protein n=1 Tax=Sphingomonas jinjuensis TaxID=535907 RepID=A0A840FII1_9SPHN|nr:hypothetical protein [Sphingomonas jinjuensis]MBB4155504.1 hypothetical protein [Sphingomonas jinjuensis]